MMGRDQNLEGADEALDVLTRELERLTALVEGPDADGVAAVCAEVTAFFEGVLA